MAELTPFPTAAAPQEGEGGLTPFPTAAAPKEDEGPGALTVAADIGKGVAAAPIDLVQGIVELGALGLDTVFDTDTSREATEFFEGAKEFIGATPELAAGKVTEDVLAFGLGFIPIAGWLNRANLVAKGAKTAQASSRFMKAADAFGKSKAGKALLGNKAKLFATTAAAAGAYETVISPEGRSTMADSFDFLPEGLQTEVDTGLTGRDEALRRLRNKLRLGAEATALSGAFDTLLYGAGAGTRALGTVPGVSEATSGAARGVIKGFDLLGRGVSRVPGAKKTGAFLRKNLASDRGLDRILYQELEDVTTLTDAGKRKAVRLLREFDKAANKTVGLLTRNKTAKRKDVQKALSRYLLGDASALDPYGPEVVEAGERLIQARVNLQDDLVARLERISKQETADTAMFQGMDSDVIVPVGRGRSDLAKAALADIKATQDAERGYLVRLFEMYENPINYLQRFKKEDLLNSQMFADAVKEVQQNLSKGSRQASEEVARDVVLDTLNMSSVKNGIDPNVALDSLIEVAKKAEMGEGGELFAKSAPKFKVHDEMFIKRKPLIDQSPALRALMGEITEPEELYITTLEKLSTTTASFDLFNRLTQSGFTADLRTGVKQLQNGARPLVIRPPDPRTMSLSEYKAAMESFEGAGVAKIESVAQAEDVLKQMGYVKMGESTSDSVFGGKFGALSGAYVAPEVEAALTNPLRLNTGFISEALATANIIRGFSQKQLIIPNPASRVRDFLGSTGMLMSNGNFARDMDVFGAFSLFVDDLSKLDEAGLTRLKTKLELSGTQESNILVNAIREYMSEGPSVGASAKLRSAMERAGKTKVLKPFKSFSDFMERVAGGTDAFFKGVAVMAEEAKLTKAFQKAGVDVANPDLVEVIGDDLVRAGLGSRARSEALAAAMPPGTTPLNAIEIMAADVVKDTMPIYSRVGEAVRALDRIPFFGNFTSFASENIRNSANILRRATKEMAYKASDTVVAELGEQGAKTLERQIRAIGAQRMASFVAVAAVAPKAMVRGSMTATGTSDAQLEMLHQQLPDFMAGHDVVILENDGKGNYKYVDLSYVSPYAFVTDSAQAALRMYQEKGYLDASEVEQLAAGAWSGFSALMDPFASESMVYERVRDVLPSGGIAGVGIGRGGLTSTGAKVYNETDSLGSQMSQGFLHVLDSMMPAYTKLAADARLGELKPGRLTRGMMEVPGPRGQEYSTYEELARQVSGFTPMELNLRRDFEFSGLAYTPKRTEAKTAANRVIRAADSTPEQIASAWDNYLNSLYREQSKLYADVIAARTLGLSEGEIRRNLVQKANIGSQEAALIMRGQFYPGTTSKEIRQEVMLQMSQEGRRRITRSVDFGALNRASSDRIGEPLSPEVYLQRQRPQVELTPLPGSMPVAETPAAPVAAPPVSPIELTPVPAAPQPPQAPAVQPPAPMELLGSDPVSQARNAEIQRRLQQQ